MSKPDIQTTNDALSRLLDERDIVGLSADAQRIFQGYDSQISYPPEDYDWDEEYARDRCLSHSDAAKLADLMIERWTAFKTAALARSAENAG